jgi:hypothetical protein
MMKEGAVTGLETLVSPEPALLLPRVHERPGSDLALVCRSCGDRWSVTPETDGTFFPGFWLCPRGCDY